MHTYMNLLYVPVICCKKDLHVSFFRVHFIRFSRVYTLSASLDSSKLLFFRRNPSITIPN